MLPGFQKSILLTITAGLILVFYAGAETGELSPRLQQSLSTQNETNPDSLVDVVVFLKDDRLKQSIRHAASDLPLTRGARITSVVGRLKSFEAPGANGVKQLLERHSPVAVIQHWIVPAFTATIPLSQIDSIAAVEGVKLIIENAPVTLDAPIDKTQAPQLAASTARSLTLLNVPYLWNRGLTGRGRLVCSFDTGVEQGHPALSSKWRGNHVPLSAAWFSKVAGDTLPSDRTGHGTHTMGIMVGSAPLDTFGVAFEAEWISAGVIDQGRPLGTTISDILEAFEWALDPDGNPNTTSDVPDVILNSWGIPEGLFAPCDETFYTAIDNVEAAGIVTIFAAGNEGPDPHSLRSPADRASTPLNSFAVGAVDTNGVIANFSSRGPSSCDAGEHKPEVVAPGIAIRSSYKGGGYMYMSGTSMAAPFIAGLVALMRQYNPDVTVEQIKNALISSCTDLGSAGEDNAYGYGLPDASKLLDYLPPPPPPQFSIVGVTILDGGVAVPGQECELQLLLNSPEASLVTVDGTVIASGTEEVTLLNDHATFFFGEGGTTALNSVPFRLALDSLVSHGLQLPLLLEVTTTGGEVLDTLEFTITAGIPPAGHIVSHITSQIDVSVSDFGQMGFAPGSIYNLDGDGFRYDASENLLYEAGVILGRSELQLSSAVRDSLGQLAPSDFVPKSGITEGWVGPEGGWYRQASFIDAQSEIPLPITVEQKTTSFPYVDDNAFLIVRYYLKNDTIEKLSNLYFGFLADFDLSGGTELCAYDETLNFLYQAGEIGPVAGLVGLKNLSSFKVLANDTGKRGFSRAELFDLIAEGGVDIGSSGGGDLMTIAGAGPFTIFPGDSVEIALALVAGDDVPAITANAGVAKQMYDLSTDVDDEIDNSLPHAFELHQNYPNPFNPTTNISFTLPSATEVTIEIYNMLGQQVRTLYTGRLPAGTHTFAWDATNNDGGRVASGMYFYRLASETFSQTRKMVLLK